MAAFEQSLSNMTARLQHLTSTAEQKVRALPFLITYQYSRILQFLVVKCHGFKHPSPFTNDYILLFSKEKIIISFIVSELRSIAMCCCFYWFRLTGTLGFFLDSVDLSPFELLYFFSPVLTIVNCK